MELPAALSVERYQVGTAIKWCWSVSILSPHWAQARQFNRYPTDVATSQDSQCKHLKYSFWFSPVLLPQSVQIIAVLLSRLHKKSFCAICYSKKRKDWKLEWCTRSRRLQVWLIIRRIFEYWTVDWAGCACEKVMWIALEMFFPKYALV